MIYLDNAATTLVKPPQVIDAVVKAMGTMGNCSRGTHEEALSAARGQLKSLAILSRAE